MWQISSQNTNNWIILKNGYIKYKEKIYPKNSARNGFTNPDMAVEEDRQDWARKKRCAARDDWVANAADIR